MSEFFEGINKINYEGPESTNPLAFRYYDANKVVAGKTMQEHLRPAICWWHTLCWPGSDVFGDGTFGRPWHDGDDEMAQCEQKVDVGFEFISKMGVPYFCFHDKDVTPEGATLAESNKNLDIIADKLQAKMDETDIKLLWGTANLFSNPRFMSGAASNPDPEVFAYAAAQVKHCIETTHKLNGENYVLWGGREGYETLLNTNMKQEVDQLGRFFSMVVEHKHKIGFKGTILIEPKPHEPTKHQYDFDCATVYAFLQKYDLVGEVKANIEVNHATLAGHTFQHELEYAVGNDFFGSVDFNRGDDQCGWDTDQFPNDVEEMTLAMYIILNGGGMGTGGANFDAKIRRQSIDPADLFYAHIGGLDVIARGLENAAKMIEDEALSAPLAERYAGWTSGVGKDMLEGKMDLDSIAKHVHENSIMPSPKSGHQELLENIVNRYV
ncbi:MAG: xylose isomerase [Candidatus Hydrogenedentota bacterium]